MSKNDTKVTCVISKHYLAETSNTLLYINLKNVCRLKTHKDSEKEFEQKNVHKIGQQLFPGYMVLIYNELCGLFRMIITLNSVDYQ